MYAPSPRTMIGTSWPSPYADSRVKCFQRCRRAARPRSVPRGVVVAADSWATSWGVLVMPISCGCAGASRWGMVSPGTPVVPLPVQLEVEERLGAGHAGQPPQPREQVEHVVVVLADDLDEQVEAAGRAHQVLDLGQRLELGQRRAGVTVDPDPDHRLPGEA